MSVIPEAAEKQRLLPKLWELFQQKISLNWKDTFSSWDRISVLDHPTANFAEALRMDIITKVSAQPSQVFSAQQLLSYLRRDGFPKSLAMDRLTTILHYCGFDHWEAFKDEVDNNGYLPEPPDNGDGNWNWLGP